MPEPPIITFPGVEAVVSAHIVRGHGVTPDGMILTIAPQEAPVATSGALLILFEDTAVRIPDCVIDRASFQFDTRRRVISLILFDRRWKWRFPTVNGHYNRRNESGEIVRPSLADVLLLGLTINVLGRANPATVSHANSIPADTERSPQDLATILLAAMGEEDFDVSEMPNEIRPEVQWEQAKAALELAALCDLVGCRVVLRWDNTVKIEKLVGDFEAPLPDNLPIKRIANQFDIKERPDVITVAMAPTLHQWDFELEAVGEDLDGVIKLVADMDAAPDKAAVDGNGVKTGGWGFLFAPNIGFAFDPIAEKDIKVVADKSVFKWYRIKVPFTFRDAGFVDDPADPDDTAAFNQIDVVNLDQILPIVPLMVTTGVAKEGDPRTNLNPIVYGDWFEEDKIGKNTVDEGLQLAPLPPNVKETDEIQRIVPGGFTIDTGRGVVKFSRPIIRLDFNNAAGLAEIGVPFLRLRASFQFRNPNGSWRFHTVSRIQPEPLLGTAPLVIRHPELLTVRRAEFNTVVSGVFGQPQGNFSDYKVSHNEAAVDELANSYIDAIESEFLPSKPLMVEYVGLFPFELTGAIRTVEFELGPLGIFTRVYRDQDTGPTHSAGYLRIRDQQRISQITNELINRPPATISRRIARETRVGPGISFS